MANKSGAFRGCLALVYVGFLALFALGTLICAIPGVSTTVAVGTLALGIPLLATASALLLTCFAAPTVITVVWGQHRRWGVLLSMVALVGFLAVGNLLRARAIQRYAAQVDAMNEPWVPVQPYRSIDIAFPSQIKKRLYTVPLLTHPDLEWVRLQTSGEQWVRLDPDGNLLGEGEPVADLSIVFTIDRKDLGPMPSWLDSWFVRPSFHTITTIEQGDRVFQRHQITADIAFPLLVLGTFEVKQFSGPVVGGVTFLGWDRDFGGPGFDGVIRDLGLSQTPSERHWNPDVYKAGVNAREIGAVLTSSGPWNEHQHEVVQVWCRELDRDSATERTQVLRTLIHDPRAASVQRCPLLSEATSNALLVELLAWAEAHPPAPGGPLEAAWEQPLHLDVWRRIRRRPGVLLGQRSAILETARRTGTTPPPLP